MTSCIMCAHVYLPISATKCLPVVALRLTVSARKVYCHVQSAQCCVRQRCFKQRIATLLQFGRRSRIPPRETSPHHCIETCSLALCARATALPPANKVVNMTRARPYGPALHGGNLTAATVQADCARLACAATSRNPPASCARLHGELLLMSPFV